MSAGVVQPDLSEFRRQAADRRVIPVYRRVLVDAETAVGLYQKLADNRPGTYLLESAEQGVWSRYSFIGVRATAMLTEVGGQARWTGRPPAGVPSAGDPLDAVRGDPPPPAHAPGPEPAAVHLRSGRLSQLRRRPADRTAP